MSYTILSGSSELDVIANDIRHYLTPNVVILSWMSYQMTSRILYRIKLQFRARYHFKLHPALLTV